MHATAEPTPTPAATDTAASPAPDQITLIDRAKIRVISNIRTTFDPAYLAELGASIRAVGIQTPLWVRADGADTYALIAGECRLRASGIAGLVQVPCIIKPVDQRGALELQILENLHRRDVAPLEEGLGYQRLLQELGYTLETLIEKIQKSKSYIYGRIKLAELPRLGREALAAGQLTPSVALRVARIPNPKAQKECLGKIIAHDAYQTDSAAADLIAREYMCELKGAPFDREDPALAPPDRGPCSKCPLRSGNQTDLFPDQVKGRADICTDPACYKRKADAGWKKRSAEHKAAGGKILEGPAAARAHYSADFRELDARCWEAKGERKYRDLLKAELKDGTLSLILSRDQYGKIQELVPRKAADACLHKSGAIKKEPADCSSGWRAQQKAEATKRQKEQAIRIAQLQALDHACMSTVRETRETFLLKWLQIITVKLSAGADADACRILVKARGIDPSKHKSDHSDGIRASIAAAGREVSAWQDTMSLLMQLLTAVHYGYHGNKDPLPEFCALFQVNAEAIEKQTRAALDKRKKPAKSKPEKKAKKPAAAEAPPAKPSTSSPEGRARLAALMKARWAARKGAGAATEGAANAATGGNAEVRDVEPSAPQPREDV